MHVTICLFKFWFQIERWENGNFNCWQGSGIFGTPVPLSRTVPYLFAEDWTFILQVWPECPETKAGKIIFLGASVRHVFLFHVVVWRIIFVCRVLCIVVISGCLSHWGRLPFCPRDGSSRFVGNTGTPPRIKCHVRDNTDLCSRHCVDLKSLYVRRSSMFTLHTPIYVLCKISYMFWPYMTTFTLTRRTVSWVWDLKTSHVYWYIKKLRTEINSLGNKP